MSTATTTGPLVFLIRASNSSSCLRRPFGLLLSSRWVADGEATVRQARVPYLCSQHHAPAAAHLSLHFLLEDYGGSFALAFLEWSNACPFVLVPVMRLIRERFEFDIVQPKTVIRALTVCTALRLSTCGGSNETKRMRPSEEGHILILRVLSANCGEYDQMRCWFAL
jgi:hypothetical protein